jgi:hypothetical protein
VTGTISGSVADSSGAVIPGASVSLTNERTGDERRLITNEEGRFIFSALQPASYTIKVELVSFQTLEQKNIVLSANENLTLGALILKPGAVTETVTITATGDRPETESSDLTGRLTSAQIELISTKGRDITSLLRTMPGMSYIDDIESVGEGFGTDLPNVSGQRGRSTVASVDGLNGSEPSGNNKLSMTVNQDAIAEVKVLRNNYAAEYGNNGGALINIVSKGGGRDYHGSAYYFLRNEALNATDYFFNKAGLKKGLYRHNIWGISLGGPVQIPKIFPNSDRRKLFFFYSFERPHTITPQSPRFVTVPTELERQGDFSRSVNATNAKVFVRDPLLNPADSCNATDQTACFRDPSRATPGNPQGLNIIPKARWNSSGFAMLNFFPLPNQPSGSVRNYVSQKSVDVPKWSQLIRLDFKPSEKDSFFVKAQWWTADNEGYQTSGWPSGDANTWGISSHYLYKDNGLSMNWVHVFSGSIVNEATLGMRHDAEGFIPSDGVVNRLTRTALNYTEPQLFPSNNRLGTIPRATNWNGVAGTPANINWLDRWGETGNDYILPSFSDNLSINRGHHSYKAGVYFEHVRNGEAAGGNWTGTFNFSGTDSNFTPALGNTGYAYANALAGNFRSYSEGSTRPFVNLQIKLLQWYAQDQWKMNKRVTLNYGLRVGYNIPWRQRDGRASSFDPERFVPTKAMQLYENGCAVVFTPPETCPSASRRARDPRTGQLFTNTAIVGSFVPGSGDPLNGLALAGDPTVPKGFREIPGLTWEPRLGFAWDITGRGKTVLRAMGGVYHSPRNGGGTTGGNLVNNPPLQRTLTIDFGNIADLVNLTGTAINRPSTVNALERQSHIPASYNFSLGIQQDIGFKTVMEVSYLGSVSRYLGERRNINGIPDGARLIDCAVPNICHPENRDPVTGNRFGDDFLRAYRGFGDINTVMYSGTSNYNSLQVQINRRYTREFQYGIAYTWSKTLDYANDDSSDVFYSRPYKQFNYGPADFDQAHIFTANYIWNLPSARRRVNNRLVNALFDNWQVSGTTSLVSGKPKTNLGITNVTYTGGNNDYTGGEVQARPNVICDPNRRTGRTDATGTPVLIDTSCFARPTVLGEIGTMQRNLVRLPGVFNSDLAFFKNVPIAEKGKIQFRWETYNLFNHTNFRDIDATMTFDANGDQTNNRFGVPTSARPPRVMQASLRISF